MPDVLAHFILMIDSVANGGAPGVVDRVLADTVQRPRRSKQMQMQIQPARLLAAFWPNQGADVIPTHKSKDPSEASLRSCTHATARAPWGAGGLEAPGIWIAFAICIK